MLRYLRRLEERPVTGGNGAQVVLQAGQLAREIRLELLQLQFVRLAGRALLCDLAADLAVVDHPPGVRHAAPHFGGDGVVGRLGRAAAIAMNAGDRNRFAGGNRIQRRVITGRDDALILARRADEEAGQFQIDPALQSRVNFAFGLEIDRLESKVSFRRRQRGAGAEISAHRLDELQGGDAGSGSRALDFRIQLAREQNGGGEGAALTLPGFVARFLAGDILFETGALASA